jgi:hypothetical protein
MCRLQRETNRQPGVANTWPALLTTAALLLSGCSTVTVQSFTPSPNSNVEAAYIATDANFAQYSRILGEDMGIFSPQSRPLSDEDSQRLRQIFRTAFLGKLEHYDITDKPGPDVMAVQASLIDLRNADITDVPKMRTGLKDVARPGVLVFTMEMRDSSTGRVLARAADSTANPRIGNAGRTGTDWDSVEVAAEHWSSLFRQFLDQNLSR